MCYIWKNPTDPREEVSLETLSKLPGGFDNLNVSGGEPTLRTDLHEIIDIVYPKARITEISSNGLHPERLVPIIKKYPNIKIRFSLEGDEVTNNSIRGEQNGYEIKIAGLRQLQEAGGTVSTLSGGEWQLPTRELIGSNGEIHDYPADSRESQGH